MNEFYSQVYDAIDDAIFGQKIGFIAVTEPKVQKEFKEMGIKKVQHLVCTISKRSYLELVNTSTGIEELGVEVKSKRESFYENEKLGGLLSHLKKDPDRMKYLVVKFDTDDNRTHIQHVGEAIYVDKDMNVLDNPKQYLLLDLLSSIEFSSS